MNDDQSLKEFLIDIGKSAIAMFLIGLYFSIDKIAIIGLNIFKINYQNWSEGLVYSLLLGLNILMILIISIIYYKRINKNFIEFKEKHDDYLKKYIKYWFYGLMLMVFSNLILVSITGDIAGNENAVRELFSTSPLYIYISAVIIAPLLEELIFRFCIRDIFPHSNILFILASGLIFGGCHVYGNVTNWVDMLYIIPYSSLGFAFAYIYTKTDNIFSTIGAHFIHNGIMMALQILMFLFM